jgi:hypothetical protein
MQSSELVTDGSGVCLDLADFDMACFRRVHSAYDTPGPSSSSPLYIFAFSEHRRSWFVRSSRLFLAKGCSTLVLELLVESVAVTDGGDVVACGE